MADWVNPAPRYPTFGRTVIAKGDDGSMRYACMSNTWDGPVWHDGKYVGMCNRWSLAHPDIVGWRYPEDATPAEVLAADKHEALHMPEPYRGNRLAELKRRSVSATDSCKGSQT